MPSVPTIELENIPWECTPIVTRPELVHVSGNSLINHPSNSTSVDLTFGTVVQNEVGALTSPAGLTIWSDGSYRVIFRTNNTPSFAMVQYSLLINGFDIGIRTGSGQHDWSVAGPFIGRDGSTVLTLNNGDVLGMSMFAQQLDGSSVENVFRSLIVTKRRGL